VTNSFADTLKSGGFVVTAQCTPPRGASAEALNACAGVLNGACAISVAECEDGVRMSALAACSHLIAAGAEPILHLLTRDMNRIALQASLLGAASMGVKSVLCTSGRHQTLTDARSARGVFDVDPIQLIGIADAMRKSGVLEDGSRIEGGFDILLGTDTNPFSDPVELQVIALDKAVASGADFVVTQPAFKLDKFNAWMELVRARGIHERTCIIASVMPLASAEQAAGLAAKYSHLDIPDEALQRLQAAEDVRAEGVAMAVDMVRALKSIAGVRGICVMGDDCGAAKDVISSSGIAGS